MLLEEKGIKYSIIDKDGKKEVDKLKIDGKKIIEVVSFLYLLFSRIHDNFLELDIKLTKDKHLLVYPYKEEKFLIIVTTKLSEYTLIKNNIAKILKE